MQNSRHTATEKESLTADLAAIDGAFVEYLQRRHMGIRTIRLYRRFLTLLAHFFCQRGRNLQTLKRGEVSRLVRRQWPGQGLAARAALYHWLRLKGSFAAAKPRLPFQTWLDDYDHFLESDRGLSMFARRAYVRCAGQYMEWQFGRGIVYWGRVRPTDIWDYTAMLQRQGHKTKTVIDYLSALRQFLRFIHLRGSGSPVLSKAVPMVSDRGRAARSDVLSSDQRHRFLASFNLRSADGRRDYAMALCMVDLGLRRIEVVRLRTKDIDWERNALAVPPAKAGRGRTLPLPRHIAAALHQYLRTRPTTDNDSLFVGHAMLRGRPLSPEAVTSAIGRAYRRCGFLQWTGTHVLRRSFATRLCARGANMKEIADLLGHRLLITTDRYTAVGAQSLRALVRPWPL